MAAAAPEISLLTVAEAAEFLRVSPITVYRRVEAGELPAVRVGSGPRAPVRIASDELMRYVGRGAETPV